MDRFLEPLKQAGSAEVHRQVLQVGANVFLRHGCTSVLTNDGILIGGIPSPWDRYEELLAAKGGLPRIFLTVDWRELDKDDAVVRKVQGERLSVYRIKLWTDGALGASTAAVEEPYSDDPTGRNRGILSIEPSEIRRAVGLAQRAGLGVEAHTIGDRSARELLDAFEACGVEASQRYTLTHCQILRPELMGKMARHGVLASVQPQFATSDATVAPQRLGPGSDRLRSSYAWRTLRAAGVRLAGGSDSPVETPSPLEGIACAMENAIHPSENLSFAAALEMYTLGGAYMAFRESDLGALQRGFRADFVVTDLVGSLPDLESAATVRRMRVDEVWIGGELQHRAEAAPAPSRRTCVIAPEHPGKRGISAMRRGPCPCCGLRGLPPL